MKINNINNQPINKSKNNNNIKAKRASSNDAQSKIEDQKHISSPIISSDQLTITSKPPFENLPSVQLNEKMAQEVSKNAMRQIKNADTDVVSSQAKFELKRVLSLIN